MRTVSSKPWTIRSLHLLSSCTSEASILPSILRSYKISCKGVGKKMSNVIPTSLQNCFAKGEEEDRNFSSRIFNISFYCKEIFQAFALFFAAKFFVVSVAKKNSPTWGLLWRKFSSNNFPRKWNEWSRFSLRQGVVIVLLIVFFISRKWEKTLKFIIFGRYDFASLMK